MKGPQNYLAFPAYKKCSVWDLASSVRALLPSYNVASGSTGCGGLATHAVPKMTWQF